MSKETRVRVFAVSIVGAVFGVALAFWGGSQFGSAGDTPFSAGNVRDTPSPAADVPDTSMQAGVEGDTSRRSDAAGFTGTAQPSKIIIDAMERRPTEMLAMQGGGPDRLQSSCNTGFNEGLSGSDAPSLIVTCDAIEPGFGGMYRQVSGAPYRGQRVRLSGLLKANEIAGAGGVEGIGSLWIRIGVPGGGAAIDNGRNYIRREPARRSNRRTIPRSLEPSSECKAR